MINAYMDLTYLTKDRSIDEMKEFVKIDINRLENWELR